MLTRTDATATFEWDGFDCVRSTVPESGTAVYNTATYDTSDFGSGGITQYYVVNGMLRAISFDYAACYTVTCDALGSVRLVLDPSGSPVSSFSYDAWENVLSPSYDNLPGGMAYRFVRGLGCRWDAGTGLTYMRARWYDGAGLQRFISKDPIANDTNLEYDSIDYASLYRYAKSSAASK